MTSKRRLWKRIGLGLLALLVLIQLWPVTRTNPPVVGELAAPPEVAKILRRSCYDCHSNETRWTWYAYVAPVSWIVAHDVEEARHELNLSEWSLMTERRQALAPQKMLDKIDTGAMPLPRYIRLHPDARLSTEEIETIRRWVESSR
ncbi:MAG TPA: heme-binding domain-containing protein [Candidatus Polarisedimenticolaceae bacterium]|nr:heme-binding domain-containing protein [Candidatus Polarisedimenticolaceae bacterium]